MGLVVAMVAAIVVSLAIVAIPMRRVVRTLLLAGLSKCKCNLKTITELRYM